MKDKALRCLWCDGFIPERYLLTDQPPRITGRAWISVGPRKQSDWEFVLLLDTTEETHDNILWTELLPSEDVAGWLEVDLDGRQILVTPSRATAA